MRVRDNSIIWLIVIILMFIIVPRITRAYDGNLQIPAEGKTQIITLDDGSKLFGRIKSVSDSTVVFAGSMGEVNIKIDKIKNIEEVSNSSLKGGEYWFPNPNRSRLLFGPTARSLDQGSGYFFDVWVFFPGFAYGFTDNFMVAFGASIIPEVDDQLFYLSPKLSFNAAKDLDIAITLNTFRLFDNTLFIAIPNMTYGSDDNNVTGGIGFAFTTENAADNPAGTLGGMYRISRRIALVGEGWYLPSTDTDGLIGLGGLRFFGEKMAIDFAALAVDEIGGDSEDDALWAPYIDFVWNF